MDDSYLFPPGWTGPSASRVSMKGREVTVVPYYACPFCKQFPGTLLTSIGLMVPEGALLRRTPEARRGYAIKSTYRIELREVGRVPCADTGWDHVLCDWDWKEKE